MLAGRASAEPLSDHGVDGRVVPRPATERDCESGSKESSARNTNKPDASQRRAGARDGDRGDVIRSAIQLLPLDRRCDQPNEGLASTRARRRKALQPPAAEETDLQMKMRDDDHFGTGDGPANPGPEEHTEMGLPNLWIDRNALGPAGDSADQGLADGGDVWCGAKVEEKQKR